MERFTPAVRHPLSKSGKISYNYLNYTILLSNRQSSKRHSLSFSFGENIESGWATIVAHPLSRLRVVSGGKGFPYSPPLWRAAARSRPPYHGRIRISIRTIHADGDLTLAGGVIITFAFQPTPSLRMVTLLAGEGVLGAKEFQPTPPLRMVTLPTHNAISPC